MDKCKHGTPMDITCLECHEEQERCNHDWLWVSIGWRCTKCNKRSMDHPCYDKEPTHEH